MKVSGPLQSQNASGTIADNITFSNRKSGQQVRFQKKQKDANSESQGVQRAKFKIALCACSYMFYGDAVFGASLFGNSLDLYSAAADRKNVTDQNECVSQYLS